MSTPNQPKSADTTFWIAMPLSIGLPIIAILTSFYFYVRHRAKKDAVARARDIELADLGRCVYCAHKLDHSECETKLQVKHYNKPNRCVYCGQKADHRQCEAVYGKDVLRTCALGDRARAVARPKGAVVVH
jgi:hypothetical protein